MTLPTFSSWINHRPLKVPQADHIVQLISRAGPNGISRGEIGGSAKLDRETLDELLDGLVQVGWLSVADFNGVRVYRAKM